MSACIYAVIAVAFVLVVTLPGCGCDESSPKWDAKKLTDSDGNEYAVKAYGCGFQVIELKK